VSPPIGETGTAASAVELGVDDGKRESVDVKVGDTVLYAKYAGTEFKIDENDLLIVSQKDILAIVED
jgi:chaperonin GroES